MSPPKRHLCTFRIIGFGDHVRIRAGPRAIPKNASSHAFRGVPLGWRVGVLQRSCGETHRSRMFAVWCLLHACRRRLATHGSAPCWHTVVCHAFRCAQAGAVLCALNSCFGLRSSEIDRFKIRLASSLACLRVGESASWHVCVYLQIQEATTARQLSKRDIRVSQHWIRTRLGAIGFPCRFGI